MNDFNFVQPCNYCSHTSCYLTLIGPSLSKRNTYGISKSHYVVHDWAIQARLEQLRNGGTLFYVAAWALGRPVLCRLARDL